VIEHFDFEGKSVLVTGGTGSFGNAFVNSVLKTTQSVRIVVFSRDEHKQRPGCDFSLVMFATVND